MDNKLFLLYDLITRGVYSKDTLANKLNVTTKTIENKVKLSNGDIVYDKKLKAYRFTSILPKMVSYGYLLEVISNGVDNMDVSADIKNISTLINNKNILVGTSTLSETLQTVLSIQTAINHNIVLNINYVGNDNAKKNKIICPNQIVYSNSKYYLYVTYDKKNKVNVGEQRTLFINSISNITKERYEQNVAFQTNYKGNAFGKYCNNKYVELIFSGASARYVKRERIQSMHYEIISEDFTGDKVLVKYYYNNTLEIISLIQRWMPMVRFAYNDDFSKNIYDKILSNFNIVKK